MEAAMMQKLNEDLKQSMRDKTEKRFYHQAFDLGHSATPK